MTNTRSERFPYQTTNPWPFPPQYGDWAVAISDLELWLEHNVGSCMVQWAWAGGQCKIAFAQERDLVLFLLRWS